MSSTFLKNTYFLHFFENYMANKFINYMKPCDSCIKSQIFTSEPCILMDKNTWLGHIIYARIKNAIFCHF